MTAGSIGDGQAGKIISKQVNEENIINDIFVAKDSLSGSCPTTVCEGDRTCIAVLDACKKYPSSHMANMLSQNYV